MDAPTLASYNDNADEASRCYEAAAGGVASMLPFVFEPGETVLEIGAGSGRDASARHLLGLEKSL